MKTAGAINNYSASAGRFFKPVSTSPIRSVSASPATRLRSSAILEPDASPYQTVSSYTKNPLISGYVSPENLTLMGGSAAVISEGMGRGSVTVILDDPNFRGFWYGTNKILLNGLFFSSMISPDQAGGDRAVSEQD